MGNTLTRIGICALIAATVWTAGIVSDKQNLHRNLVRLHVVAASNSDEDQCLKLKVRDAVIESLQEHMMNLTDPVQAKEYLQAKIILCLTSVMMEHLE